MSKVLDLLKDILNLFIQKFPKFVSGLVRKIPPKLKEQIKVLIKVVENIENFVDSPASDFLTAVIPGEADDKLKDWLRKVLPGVLNTLKIIDVTADGTISVLLEDDRDAKNLKLGDIATLLTKELTGASLGQSRITAEVVFQDYKKENS